MPNAAKVEGMRTEYDQQIQIAMNQHPLVKMAGDHISLRTRAMVQDQQKLANQFLFDYEQKFQDKSGAELRKLTLEFLDKELTIVRLFDVARRSSGAPLLPAQVSAHKLLVILPKVYAEFAAEEDGSASFHRMVQGHFDPDPSCFVQWPVLRTNSYWGSNKGTIESAKMLCFKLATSTDTIANYSETSIAHIAPLPSLPASFQPSGSKFFTQVNVAGEAVPGFGFIHGGYAFGGQRGELKHFEYGPEDCSSMVHNWLQATGEKTTYQRAAFTIRSQLDTSELLYTWRTKQTKGSYFIKNTSWSRFLETRVQSAVNAEEVKPGDIHLLRTFSRAMGCPDDHATGSGHTGIVIGDDPDDASRVLMFECARDMELEDPTKNRWGCAGAGIGSFQKHYENIYEDKFYRTMFLRPV